eukprot:366400-Chlamydomonas_euryale.AAC.1
MLVEGMVDAGSQEAGFGVWRLYRWRWVSGVWIASSQGGHQGALRGYKRTAAGHEKQQHGKAAAPGQAPAPEQAAATATGTGAGGDAVCEDTYPHMRMCPAPSV